MFKVFSFMFFFVASLGGVENYLPLAKQFIRNDTLFLVSRSFEKEAKRYYLFTNTRTLQTAIAPLNDSVLTSLDKRFYATPFYTLLNQSTRFIKQGGATHAFIHHPKALYLTMDMCPSKKAGYESDFIQKLTQLKGKTPIAIALSSAWVKHHEAAFSALANEPLLDITWVNHSHNHFYDSSLKERENFMLHESTQVSEEILGLEKLLIERGMTPSIFFRFPGLMANESLMRELKETYFLIPLGANAWIAKEEPIHEDGFILIHGNKNEPKGIEMLSHELEHLQDFFFLPITKAFIP